jgi:hypothetical protein
VDSTGKGYLIAYNYTSAPLTTNFVWTGPVASIAVTTDTGTTTLAGVRGAANVKFTDTFGPYEARVYIITP